MVFDETAFRRMCAKYNCTPPPIPDDTGPYRQKIEQLSNKWKAQRTDRIIDRIVRELTSLASYAVFIVGLLALLGIVTWLAVSVHLIVGVLVCVGTFVVWDIWLSDRLGNAFRPSPFEASDPGLKLKASIVSKSYAKWRDETLPEWVFTLPMHTAMALRPLLPRVVTESVWIPDPALQAWHEKKHVLDQEWLRDYDRRSSRPDSSSAPPYQGP